MIVETKRETRRGAGRLEETEMRERRATTLFFSPTAPYHQVRGGECLNVKLTLLSFRMMKRILLYGVR